MHRIKLHRPTGDVIGETLYKRLAPQPGDIVIVFDPTSVFVGNITFLDAIDDSDPREPFIAALDKEEQIFRWTYAYKVPEGYASVETTND